VLDAYLLGSILANIIYLWFRQAKLAALQQKV